MRHRNLNKIKNKLRTIRNGNPTNLSKKIGDKFTVDEFKKFVLNLAEETGESEYCHISIQSSERYSNVGSGNIDSYDTCGITIFRSIMDEVTYELGYHDLDDLERHYREGVGEGDDWRQLQQNFQDFYLAGVTDSSRVKKFSNLDDLINLLIKEKITVDKVEVDRDL